MLDRIQMIKAAAEKNQERRLMKNTVAKLDKRKKKIGEEMRLHKKLTRSVQKAGHQQPGSLDCFKEENMFYTDKETQDYIAGSSYMDVYNEMKNDWD
jgi:hypothetical protein